MRNLFYPVALIFLTIICCLYSKDVSIAIITIPMAFIWVFKTFVDEEEEYYYEDEEEIVEPKEPKFFDLREENVS